MSPMALYYNLFSFNLCQKHLQADNSFNFLLMKKSPLEACLKLVSQSVNPAAIHPIASEAPPALSVALSALYLRLS